MLNQGDYFATTRWTVVLHAGRRSSPQSDEALAELCRCYWYPLYAYIRRQGSSKEDAEDLTQAFFERLLSKNYLEGLAAERGRFRAFLMAALKHFLSNERDRVARIKRGGGVEHLSLDWEAAGHRYELNLADPANPEQAYDKEWALALLDRVLERLGRQYADEGKSQIFEHLRGCLTVGVDSIPHGDVAQRLGMEEGAIRVAVYRLRKRYREMLREEISQTVSGPREVEMELRALRAALS